MQDKLYQQFVIQLKGEEIRIPEQAGFTLKSGENAIFPFRMNLSGVTLLYATAQVLTRLDESHYVFFAPEGILPEFSLEALKGMNVRAGNQASLEKNNRRFLVRITQPGGTEIEIQKADGKRIRVLVLEKSQALNAWIGKVQGAHRLLLSKATFLNHEPGWKMYSLDTTVQVQIYPKLSKSPTLAVGTLQEAKSKVWSNYTISLPEQRFDVAYTSSSASKGSIQLPSKLPTSVHDLWLTIDYLGDTGMMFQGANLLADEFYKGIPWTIGLRQFIKPNRFAPVDFYFRPLYSNATYLADLPLVPDFTPSKRLLKVKGIQVRPEYQTEIRF